MLDIDRFIKALLKKTNSSDYLCFITGKKNFRLKILESYKGNRPSVRPELLTVLKEYILEWHNGFKEDVLEADDLLGLYSHKVSNPKITTIDKDLKIVPNVPIYNWDSRRTIKTTPFEALRFHMWQTLVGDKTDNYKGCRGIGPVKADKILNQGFKRLMDFTLVDTEQIYNLQKKIYWELIVEAYESRGFTEEDALVQARCAYILNRPEDYDFKSQTVTLWKPT